MYTLFHLQTNGKINNMSKTIYIYFTFIMITTFTLEMKILLLDNLHNSNKVQHNSTQQTSFKVF